MTVRDDPSPVLTAIAVDYEIAVANVVVGAKMQAHIRAVAPADLIVELKVRRCKLNRCNPS